MRHKRSRSTNARFEAEEIHRITYPDRRIVAEMAVGHARFRVADEALDASSFSPQTLKGTTVIISDCMGKWWLREVTLGLITGWRHHVGLDKPRWARG